MKTPEPEDRLDAVVRAQLDAEAARTDPRATAARVLARLKADAHAAPARRWLRAAAVTAVGALAAAVLFAAFALKKPEPVPHEVARAAPAPPDEQPAVVVTTPIEVVRHARVALTRDDVRCYRVTVDATFRELSPLLAGGPERTVCTRGDRFVVRPGFGGKGAWGRDANGRVWVAPSPDGAAVFDESECPPWLRNAVKLHALDTDTILDEVLSDFDLTWTEPPAAGADAYRVSASKKGEPGPLRLASAELVIDARSKVIRSLALTRRGFGPNRTTVTFTLQPDARATVAFGPEGYINPGASVRDRTRPGLRMQLLRQHFGDGVP